MKILKLLNKTYLSILIIFSFFIVNSFSQDEPVDIWNIDKDQIQENSENKELISIVESELETEKIDVFNMQTKDRSDSIQVDETLNSKEIKIIGLYDPGDFGLTIDMWSNSNGDQLKYLFSNLAKINLSRDASELMNIVLLTNAHYPKKNISEKDFLKIKSDWLIKHNNLELIEEYLIKNDILNLHPKLSKYLVDKYLSESKLDKACKIFLNNSEPIKNNYLSKFNIYCLINSGKKDEAQLIFDLKKELGFNLSLIHI